MRERRNAQSRAGVVAALLATAVAACGTSGSADPATSDVPSVVAEGAELYAASCAACHGANLEGEADWRVANDDGSFKAPPHDSSGHTWHHGDLTLLQIITEGGGFAESRMPAFSETLTDAEILKILEFIKSQWGPDEREFQRSATLRELEASSQ